MVKRGAGVRLGAPRRGGPGQRRTGVLRNVPRPLARPVAATAAPKRYVAKTKQQQKMHQSGIRRPGGSYSYFNYGVSYKPKIMGAVKKALAKHVKVITQAGTATSSIGTQTYYAASKMFTVTDMKDMTNDIDSSQFRQICFQSVKSRTLLQNQDNGICRMTIFDVIGRRDSTNDNYDEPALAWYSGAVALGDGSSPTVLGATPYAVPGFTNHFKILKTTHVMLQPGELHEHVTKFKPHRMLQTNLLFTSEHDVLKGFTCFTVIVHSGGISNDTTIDSEVSIGKCKVDWVNTKEYKYVYLDRSIPTYQYSNTLRTTFTNGEEMMNIATGARANDQQA